MNVHSKTPGGAFVVFDATDPSFLPGKFPKWLNNGNGPWFFQPSEWCPPHWDHTSICRLTGIPMGYSPGYRSAEEAMADAISWEKEKGLAPRK